MLDALDNARTVSSDPPDAAAPELGTRDSTSGSVGRPPVDIDPQTLAVLSAGRVSHRRLGELYNCHPRTIRRRLLEYGLSQPGPPVYTDRVQADGAIERFYYPGISSDLSQLTDDELDQVLLNMYHQFPSFGRRMIDGYLLQLGERVPRGRIEASYRRVIGPPPGIYGARRIQRRVYSVPGPMALLHHDGQHGIFSYIVGFDSFLFSRQN